MAFWSASWRTIILGEESHDQETGSVGGSAMEGQASLRHLGEITHTQLRDKEHWAPSFTTEKDTAVQSFESMLKLGRKHTLKTEEKTKRILTLARIFFLWPSLNLKCFSEKRKWCNRYISKTVFWYIKTYFSVTRFFWRSTWPGWVPLHLETFDDDCCHMSHWTDHHSFTNSTGDHKCTKETTLTHESKYVMKV